MNYSPKSFDFTYFLTHFTEADNDPPQDMGDATKTELSEADSDAFDAKRSEAMAALGDAQWQKAAGTNCIKIGHPGKSIL